MGAAGMAWANVVPQLLYVLVFLAGLVVTIIVAVRSKSSAGTLAVIAFALLFVMSLLNFARGPLVGWIGDSGGLDAYVWSTAGVGCCCGSLDVVAYVLLIIALSKALGGKGKKAKDAGEVLPEAEAVVMPEAPQELSDAGAETPTIGISG